MDVTELVEHICDETGLDNASGSLDRLKALACANRAHRTIAVRERTAQGFAKEVYQSIELDMPFGPGGAFGNLANVLDPAGNLIGELAGINHVWYAAPALGAPVARATEVSAASKLTRIPIADLMEVRAAATNSDVPKVYAIQGRNMYLPSFGPALSGSDALTLPVIVVHGWARPINLTEGMDETYIRIDPAYHEDIIGRQAMCYVLEGWEGQEERASYHRGLLAEQMPDFRLVTSRMAGKESIGSSSAASYWGTPSMLKVR